MLTGLANVSLNTLGAGRALSMAVLAAYLAAVTGEVPVLDYMDLGARL